MILKSFPGKQNIFYFFTEMVHFIQLSIASFKYQKQPFADVLKIFVTFIGKTPVLEPLFN